MSVDNLRKYFEPKFQGKFQFVFPKVIYECKHLIKSSKVNFKPDTKISRFLIRDLYLKHPALTGKQIEGQLKLDIVPPSYVDDNDNYF